MDNTSTAKQVFFYSVINYIGTAIGIISALLIYPRNYAFYGTVKHLDAIAQLMFPIMVLGGSHALIKFYPALDDKHKRQLFNYSLLSIAAIGLIVLAGIVLFSLLGSYEEQNLLYIAFPIAVSLAYVELFKKQSQDMQKIAVPTLYEKIIPKIFLPVVFLLFVNQVMEFYPSLFAYASGFLLLFVLTAIYLFRRFKPGFNYRFKTLFGQISRKDYFRYSLYSFTGSLGSMLAFRLDALIIPEFISEEANGIFGNAVTIATVLQIPAIGMFALYAPIISDYLKSQNFKDLQMKYIEVAKVLLFIGALLLSCIILGIDNLFQLMPTYDELKPTIPLIYILGCSVLFNMATGFNGEIITYSRYYRFNLIMILILIVLNISLNMYVIYYTDWGLIGIACASLISMAVFNIIKMGFVYKKFGLLPFDRSFALLAVIFATSGTAIYFLPETGMPLVDLIYKTGLSLAVNVIAVYKLRLVYQVNVTIDKMLGMLKR